MPPAVLSFIPLSQELQAQRNQQLANIIQGDVRDPQALLCFLPEGIEDEDNITEQEQQRPAGKHRGKGGRGGKEVGESHHIQQHHRADIHHPEDLERHLRGNLPEDPYHEQRGEHYPDARTQPRGSSHAHHGHQVQHMPG